MTPIELLAEWQKQHGRLSEVHRHSFLKRSEVRQILQHPDTAVRSALRREKKLRGLLRTLERASATTPDRTAAKKRTVVSNSFEFTSARYAGNVRTRPGGVPELARRRYCGACNLLEANCAC